MSRWSLALLGAVLALTAAACDLLASVADPLDLDGSTWRLVSIDGQAPVAGTEPTITFDAGSVSGTTGCNSFFGGYTVSGSSITIGALGTTMMACEQPLSEQEGRIVERVGAAETIQVADGELQLVGPVGSLGFVPAGWLGSLPASCPVCDWWLGEAERSSAVESGRQRGDRTVARHVGGDPAPWREESPGSAAQGGG